MSRWPSRNSALRARSLTIRDLRAAEDQVRGRGRSQVLTVLRNASGKAANPFESALRAISVEVPGLRLMPQLGIAVAGRERVTPDLVDERLGIVVEADSHTFHTTRAQLSTDCWRYGELVLARWQVFRFTWEQVMFRQAWVRSVLMRAVRSRCPRTDKPGSISIS